MEWLNERENLRKYIQDGKLSYEAIGRIYNCSGNAVKKAAKKLGIELQQRRVINVNETFNKNTGSKFICPNCGEPFDGHECENCKYTEER